MAKITRDEIWKAILLVYPSLKVFSINSTAMGGVHIKRNDLITIAIEMGCLTSELIPIEVKEKLKLGIEGFL